MTGTVNSRAGWGRTGRAGLQVQPTHFPIADGHPSNLDFNVRGLAAQAALLLDAGSLDYWGR